MADVTTNLSVRGSGETASGAVFVATGSNPMEVLGGYWGQSLAAEGNYDPGSKKLTLVVSGMQASQTFTVKFLNISPSLALQLRSLVGSGRIKVSFQSVFPSIVGMELAPVG